MVQSQPSRAGSSLPCPESNTKRPALPLGKSRANLCFFLFDFFLTCRSTSCLITPQSRSAFLPVWFQWLLGKQSSEHQLHCETLRNAEAFSDDSPVTPAWYDVSLPKV